MLTAVITLRVPRKYKPRFKERSRPLYSVQTFKKRPCLANLASHVISCGLLRQGVIYLQELSWVHNHNLKVGQRSHWVISKTALLELIGVTVFSKGCVNCDFKLTNEVQHYKQTSLVKSLSEARRTLPRMWLQPTEEITEHAKGNDDWEAIITKNLRDSHIKRKIKERRRTSFFRREKNWGMRERITELWD